MPLNSKDTNGSNGSRFKRIASEAWKDFRKIFVIVAAAAIVAVLGYFGGVSSPDSPGHSANDMQESTSEENETRDEEAEEDLPATRSADTQKQSTSRFENNDGTPESSAGEEQGAAPKSEQSELADESQDGEQKNDDDTGSLLDYSTASRDEMKQLLLKVLYNGLGLGPEDDGYVSGESFPNDWGCPYTKEAGASCHEEETYTSALETEENNWATYDGGHSGWDSRTLEDDGPFYSLTAGVVEAAGLLHLSERVGCNDIAVHDASNHTTIYLHASSVAVSKGQHVEVGQILGYQGDSCVEGVPHVHVEVRRGLPQILYGLHGRPRIYARGAGLGAIEFPASELSIDPLPHLYESVRAALGDSGGNSPDRICPDASQNGKLIRQANQPEIYVVKVIDCKAFKRRMLNQNVIDAYEHLENEDVREVSTHVFLSYQTSTLARRIRDDGLLVFHHLHVTGAETGERRLIDLTESEMEQAGLDLDSVFIINTTELLLWGPGRDYVHTKELGEVIAAQGQ